MKEQGKKGYGEAKEKRQQGERLKKRQKKDRKKTEKMIGNETEKETGKEATGEETEKETGKRQQGKDRKGQQGKGEGRGERNRLQRPASSMVSWGMVRAWRSESEPLKVLQSTWPGMPSMEPTSVYCQKAQGPLYSSWGT